ncbi:beta-1,4-galactosyltransferase 1-like [Lingula anatina]|uniref:Beta-1,4-galactosyltransferase 1-like n=1 Tax=Lingula anatina TaxID=7574 RepID=A0A1S3JX63_LINAN|nr:beta-1,4-galactosyltransferase 1-like [Lingula anatina]|eukprot:XP_013415020.1 beta-1,4-galactosyltransferase 1-like [Lingula anatina]
MVGNTGVTKNFTISLQEVSQKLQSIDPGGKWNPRDCLARNSVTLVVPFRDRWGHLAVFLNFMHPFLQRQLLHYRILVVEQIGIGVYNKAMLMNAAFLEIRQQFPTDCVIFHDVDLIPELNNNSYACAREPRHLAPAVDVLDYNLPYGPLVGGVLMFTPQDFQAVNGYSNAYWGWGAEDDDMGYRIKKAGLRITRPSLNTGRYTMLVHTQRRKNERRVEILHKGMERQPWDGLSNVNYSVLDIRLKPLFTHMLIDIGKTPDTY